jgi:hypothetical protein
MSPPWMVKSGRSGTTRSMSFAVGPRVGFVSPIAKKRSLSPAARLVQKRPPRAASAPRAYA